MGSNQIQAVGSLSPLLEALSKAIMGKTGSREISADAERDILGTAGTNDWAAAERFIAAWNKLATAPCRFAAHPSHRGLYQRVEDHFLRSSGVADAKGFSAVTINEQRSIDGGDYTLRDLFDQGHPEIYSLWNDLRSSWNQMGLHEIKPTSVSTPFEKGLFEGVLHANGRPAEELINSLETYWKKKKVPLIAADRSLTSCLAQLLPKHSLRTPLVIVTDDVIAKWQNDPQFMKTIGNDLLGERNLRDLAGFSFHVSQDPTNLLRIAIKRDLKIEIQTDAVILWADNLSPFVLIHELTHGPIDKLAPAGRFEMITLGGHFEAACELQEIIAFRYLDPTATFSDYARILMNETATTAPDDQTGINEHHWQIVEKVIRDSPTGQLSINNLAQLRDTAFKDYFGIFGQEYNNLLSNMIISLRTGR